MTRMERSVAVGVALSFGLAGVGALGGGVAAANPPHITVGVYPSCTRSALQDGLQRGFATVHGGTIGRGFACSGDWAYAEVDTRRFTLTSVFHGRDGRWVTVRRGPACDRDAVPRAIRRAACATN